MRKADMISNLAQKTGIPRVDILVCLETFFKEVKSSLAEGEPVYVRGFGSFILKERREKTGRNIRKNVTVKVPEHFAPFFKPAKEFKQLILDSEHNLVAHSEEDLVEEEVE